MSSRNTQRSSVEYQDIVAAIFVLGTDPTECDYVDPVEAYSNLPGATGGKGGKIFVLPGTYGLATTVPLGGPDGIPVRWEGSGPGSTAFDVGAAAIPAFTILDASPSRVEFEFSNMEIRGDGLTSGQSAIAYQDSTSFAVVEGRNLLVEGTLETFFDIQAFDTTLTRPFSSSFSDSRLVPPSMIPGEIVKCFNPAGTNSAVSFVHFDGCDSGGVFGSFGWSIDADLTFVCAESFLNISLPSAVTGLNADNSLVFFMNGSADFEVYIGNNFGPGTGSTESNFLSFSTDARIILKYGAQFFVGCQFGAVTVRCDTQIATNIPYVFSGCNFSTGGTEAYGLEFDTIIGGIVSGCQFLGWTTAGIHIHDSSQISIGSDCVFSMSGGANTVLEDGTSDGNRIDGIGLGTGAGVSSVGSATVVIGVRLATKSASSTNALVTVVPQITNPKGLQGAGKVKNTDGANSIDVKESFTDAFGVTSTKTTTVTFGNFLPLNLGIDIGTGSPPYISYKVEVIDTVAGNHATYEVRFASQGAL